MSQWYITTHSAHEMNVQSYITAHNSFIQPRVKPVNTWVHTHYTIVYGRVYYE